jgi:hypothetical protein
MNGREFAETLTAFAAVLSSAGAGHSEGQIQDLASLFSAAPNSKVSSIVSQIGAASIPQEAGTPSLGDVASSLSSLKRLIAHIAKPGAIADVDSVKGFLAKRPSIGLATFLHAAVEALSSKPSRKRNSKTSNTQPKAKAASPIRDDLVAEYKRLLEEALGESERFGTTYRELSSDSAMGKAELCMLAKEMTGISGRSKAEALKKIWSRHRSLVAFKAKSNATGGRSAA